MAEINNLDDEQNLNDILSERKDIINDINELLGNSNDLTNNILNNEIEINNSLEDEKLKREEINESIVEEVDNEDKVLEKLNDVNTILENEKDLRTDINTTIDEQKNKLTEVKDTSEQMSSALTSAITSQIQSIHNLTKKLGKVVNAYNHITNAANAASNATSQVGNGGNGSGNGSGNGGGIQNIEDYLDKYIGKKSKLTKQNVALYIYEGIKNFAKISFQKWIEIDDKVHKVGRTIGMTGAQARAMVEDITNNYGDMADRLGMTFEEIFKFQESYNKSIGRGTILANEQVEAMAGLSKLVGDTAVEDVVKNMDDLGASTDTATLYLTQNMARARAHGLDAKKTSEAFANNIKLASKYNFREGVNGISKMTLLSQKLKFNMDSIANAAEKFETVEGAIGTAANLQMLGGSFAAQFGNPLEAMNMAMLDMEGFTNKIVDTFKGKATFNRETGQAEMSAIDKRFLKEAAKQLGIEYEEAWKMATQSAKINDIERSFNPTQTFTEEQKALIANKSIFKDGQHQITFYGEDNEKITKGIDQITPEDLKFLTDEKTTEVAMADDVHSIKNTLEQYLGKTVRDTKSTKETYEGKIEKLKIEGANAIDNVVNHEGIRNATEGSNPWLYGGLLVGANVLGNFLNNNIKNIIDKWFTVGHKSGSITSGTGTTTPPNSNPPSGNPSSGTSQTSNNRQRQSARNRLRARRLGKITKGVSALSKKIPYIGTALAIMDGVVEGANAVSKYNLEKTKIENSNLSTEEKLIAKTEAKRERNKGVGESIGGTAGALGGAAAGAKVGAAIGTFFGPGIGTAIGGLLGGAIGGAAGYFMGKGTGGAIGESITTEEKIENKDTTNNIKSEENQNISLVLHQIKDVNQQIYDLLLNKQFLLSEKINNNNTSFDKNGINTSIKQLSLSDNKFFNNDDYNIKHNSNNINDLLYNNTPIISYNKKEYGLSRPLNMYDNSINEELTDVKKDEYYNTHNSKSNLLKYNIYEDIFDEAYTIDTLMPYKNKQRIYTKTINDKNELFSNNENSLYKNAISKNDLSYFYNNSNGLITNANYQYNGNKNELLNNFTEKSYYNDETKQVEMSAYDKRLMKNVAKQLNISYDDAWSMVSQNVINNNAYANENPYNTQNYKNSDLTNTNEVNYRNNSYLNDSSVKDVYYKNDYNEVNYRNNSYLSEVSVKDINYNNDNVTPKVSVGLPTSIKETSVNNYNNSSYNNIGSNKLDLNVSGTIKLTSDRGGNVDIDFNKLLNNTEFMNNLINLISQDFNKRVNGQRENKNSVISLQNGGYNYNIFNATTNGWA